MTQSVDKSDTMPVSPSAPTKRRSTWQSPNYVQNRPPQHVERRYYERAAALRSLGFTTYGDYLKSPHWTRLRATYRQSDLPQACICGEVDVHLHHLTYERIGAERLSDLTPLCRDCHALVHVLEWRGEIGLDLDGLCDADRARHGQEWLASHVVRLKREAKEHRQTEQQAILALPFPTRLIRAATTAKRRHVDVARQIYVLKAKSRNGQNAASLTRQLRVVEAAAYGWDGWQDLPD